MSITRTLAATLAVAALAVPAAQAQADGGTSAAPSNDSATQGPLPGPPTWPVNPQPITNAAAVDSATQGPLPGPPTWPKNPQPITASPANVAAARDTGANWTAIALAIVGSLIAIGGLTAAAVHRSRRTQRLHIPV